MTIAQALFQQLTTLDLPFNLQNEDGSYRIFPNYAEMADKGYPALICELENYQPGHTYDGTDGLPEITARVIAVGQSFDDADAMGTAIAQALDGTSGTWGDMVIRGCFLEELSEEHFTDTDMESILYYAKTAEFKVFFQP